ncbi:18741_t:CDS:2, partial [Funneliformis geosporum]
LAQDAVQETIDRIQFYLNLYKLSEQQANEWLGSILKSKKLINEQKNELVDDKDRAIDHIEEVERKKKALERKIKKISSDPNKKKAGLADLNYSQENYAKNQLKLSANQSLKDYVRSAKTPEERRQREDEIRTLLNKYEQESTKTRALTSIIGVLLIGSIIGLIIYLVKRNKNK